MAQLTDPQLSLQLTEAGRIIQERRDLVGDGEGQWQIESPLNLPNTDQPLTFSVVCYVKDAPRCLVSATFTVAEFLEQAKASPNGYRLFITCGPCDLVQTVTSLSIRTAPLVIVDDSASQPISDGSNSLYHEESKSSKPRSCAEEQIHVTRDDLDHVHARFSSLPISGLRANMLFPIGLAYHRLYKSERNVADLDRAISIQRDSISTNSSGPHGGHQFGHLSDALEDRFNVSGDPVDIDDAIQALRDALNLIPPKAPTRLGRLIQLASQHSSRLKRLGDVKDIDTMITIYSEALELVPEGSSVKGSIYDILSRKLLSRFQRLNVLEDSDRAISYLERAIELTPRGSPKKAVQYANLGAALGDRHKRLGVIADLDKAISYLEIALRLMPDGDTFKPACCTSLASNVQARYASLGTVADFDSAISYRERAVNLTPNGHPEKPVCYYELGSTLLSRYERLSTATDLEKAISSLEMAVNLTPEGHSEKPSRYNNLGISQYYHFQYFGALEDLGKAISSHESAINLSTDGHSERSSAYMFLGVTLLARYKHLSIVADVDNAILFQEKAVTLTPDNHPHKPTRYANLGTSYFSRFERSESIGDLEMAIQNQENALKLASETDPHKASYYTNVGTVLAARYIRLSTIADLERVISCQESAIALTPDDHKRKPTCYSSLAGSLESRYRGSGSIEDLDNAISCQERAVSLTPDGHPDKSSYLHKLATIHRNRFLAISQIEDLESASSLYAKSASSLVGPSDNKLLAAMHWSRCAKELNKSPLPASTFAINLLPQVAWLGIPVADQHSLLGQMGSVVGEAVAAAIEVGKYAMAVEWLEQGRSIVWQNLLKLRTPVDDLSAMHPELATQLQSISQQLNAPTSHEYMPQIQQDKQPLKSHTSLALEWEDIVNKIRKLSNFESFLKPKAFDTLTPAAHEDPVVILNVAEDRCDALALIPGGDKGVSVVSIPLRSFSLKQSEKLLLKLTTLLRQVGVRDGETRKPTQQPRDMDIQKEFKSILYTLWVAVVKPVLDGLGYQHRETDLPRIWWYTTGPLTFLPIHAAGDYDEAEAGHKLSDYVVSSYTPTLTAILDSSYPIPSKDFKLLTVAQPSAPGYSTIPKTMEEIEKIAKAATSISVVSLAKEAATVERVQKEMRESHWVHLACHGKQDASKPIESGLILHDGTLKLSAIIKETLPKADFAFLSACQTAMGDKKVAEESVHLAAGMLLAGYKGVIATMWSIRDNDGPRAAEVVYNRMLKDGKPNRREAAYALHEAVKQLRESGADFTSWVPFIHIGR